MKKYLLGIFAIILAVGFSAFSGTPKHKTTNLFWYRYDLSTGVGTQIGSGAIDIDSYSGSDKPDCTRQATMDCARGYNSTKSQGTFPTDEVDGLSHP
jgi:hypothetical protein